MHGYRAKYRLDEQEVQLGETSLEVLAQEINNYRKVTIHVIELIATWRAYLKSLTHDRKAQRQSLPFYCEERNYLLTLLNDSAFLSTSFLANFLPFATRNDPLLLRPLLTFEKREREGTLLSFEDHQLKLFIQLRGIDPKALG